MFKRLRQMEISLAAKCQMLFGAAVVMIIAAALFVPWQRMEDLTQQLNERTARALADSAIANHITQQGIASKQARGLLPTSLPTTLPVDPKAFAYLPPHLVLASAINDPRRSTPFEQRAYVHFIRQTGDDFFYRSYKRDDGTLGYRYAKPFYRGDHCIQCHDTPAPISTSRSAAATSIPKSGDLIGLISIDIPSQIEPNQLLLNRVLILIAGLLAGTLALAALYMIITRLILQPVRVLQETAEKVSEGDLNIRSHICTGDEFQQLSETFNAMLSNLKAGEDQLRAINKSLDLKLEQLAESNVALYESNRLKSEFLANVSHELRTPLNSILGFTEILKESQGISGDPKATRYIQNIMKSGRSLLELINDLLDLAKIEAGRMEVRSEPLSLNDLFEGLTSILKPLIETKTILINPGIAADVPILHTDPAKLQQILYNFLANAIKFSPPGAQIELVAQRQDDEYVKISVTDHGPGIELDKQGIIFEKFRQIDGSVTREHGGTGLGLAISKELVVLLGGSIGVRSTPGEGATFWIVLPLKIQAGSQDLRAKSTTP